VELIMKRLAIAATLFVVAACAHQQPVATPPEADPAPAKVAAAPAPAPAADPIDQKGADLDALLKGLVIRFGFDQADLSPDSRQRLDSLADAMKARPAVHIRIAGNCDELGTVEYNLALGQKRADAVRGYLVKLGVAESRVDTVSYGKEKPVDERHTEEAWNANRRAEMDKK
jgi:peptidoglycan-associated lipoprotein